MKTIGLLGGMSWESTAIYYQLINKRIKERLGGHHSAEIILYSVDFQRIKDLQHRNEWEKATEEMIRGAKRVEQAGADFLVICTNTMHKMAGEVQSSIQIPLIHIADATGEKITQDNFRRVGLYKGRLMERFGLEVIVPTKDERMIVHDVIYNELTLGVVREESKQKYLQIIEHLAERGAEAIILGCTEITMLVGQKDVSLPVYDTTAIHAIKAADFYIDQ
ncbi:aspartate/glutamate racemase family protein [Thermoflavimicrobium dichotomicum]|uniref:Aspartate racemase n=1 Tax=Thermoflavimicrobium dichotomicum TaxID=46223 RepID=A0A1I3TWU2_9BACL|nr:aspartate/glutamate racemase family protein [Thermoflavimicrobium dichotomicum]SFJ75130.1 aspartate racemase [Thermoflavimicrobium dichotomicum]